MGNKFIADGLNAREMFLKSKTYAWLPAASGLLNILASHTCTATPASPIFGHSRGAKKGSQHSLRFIATAITVTLC